MSIKIQKTKKLFYEKYPYKITCQLVGVSYIRSYIQKHVKYVALPNFRIHLSYVNIKRYRNHQIDIDLLEEFCINCSNIFTDKNIRIRIEHNIIDFYVQDADLFNDLTTKLSKYITVITKPESDKLLEKLLEHKRHVFCDEYPHGKYKFKVILRPMSYTEKLNLIKWAEKYQNNQIYIPQYVEEFLNGRKLYYDNPYFYVEDEKTLMMVAMAAGNGIRRTEKYILNSSLILTA